MNRIHFSFDEYNECATIEELMSECRLSDTEESNDDDDSSDQPILDQIDDELDEEEEDEYEEDNSALVVSKTECFQIPLIRKSLFIGGEDVFNFPFEGQTSMYICLISRLAIHSPLKYHHLKWKAAYAPKIVKGKTYCFSLEFS